MACAFAQLWGLAMFVRRCDCVVLGLSGCCVLGSVHSKGGLV